MLKGHVFIATSLDGFIARRNGDIEWLTSFPSNDGNYGYADFIAGIDGIVMGRGSYEKVLEFDEWYYDRPVVVLSSTLPPDAVPDRLAGKVRISDLEPLALAAELTCEGWKHVYVDGGRVIQSFLQAGLIEDIVLSRIPILLGDGIPLFGPLAGDIPLEHVKTKAFPTGLVQSAYRIATPPDLPAA